MTMMNWQEIKQSIIDDLNSRGLKDPSIRIRSLNNIEHLMKINLPEYIHAPDNFKSISKDDFNELLQKYKGKYLSSAEKSIVNEIYYRISPSPAPHLVQNHSICPSCNHNIIIPTEVINESYLKCLICGAVFKNPLKPISDNALTKKQRNWLIAIAIIIVLVIIGNLSDDNTSATVRNSGYDASVHQVKSYVKQNLRDPDSYQSIEWSAVQTKTNGGYYVRHKYRAKNGFGGYVIENKIFHLDNQGNVIGSD